MTRSGIQWGRVKAVLLFLGLCAKGLAASDPLPFWFGVGAKAVAAIIWPAFDGAFMWLLTPPTPRGDDSDALRNPPEPVGDALMDDGAEISTAAAAGGLVREYGVF